MFEEAGRYAWREAPDPVITAPEQALVRPLMVACCDLDVGVAHGRLPLPPGHFSCTEKKVGSTCLRAMPRHSGASLRRATMRAQSGTPGLLSSSTFIRQQALPKQISSAISEI